MTAALLLGLALSAAPPVAKAAALVKANSYEELYLAYAAVSPDGYSAADRKALAGSLAKGCVALEDSDAVMAYSLGEKAAELDPLPEALLCVGRTGPRAEQSSAAEAALRKGLARYPKDARFPLALAGQLLAENDAAGAEAALRKVPRKSREWPEAEALRKQVSAQLAQGKAEKEAGGGARASLDKAPAGPRGAGGVTPGSGERGEPKEARLWEPPAATGLGSTYESSTDGEGRRIRANQYFRFRYFSGQRDFGQRAEYEGRVQAALESARQSANRLLGRARESPTDVILYSREEFELHHGPQAAGRILGFYSANAIRMNDSAQINERNQATLVHEYTHAVIDEAASFRAQRVPIWVNEGLAMWVEWRYEDRDGPNAGELADLRGLTKAGRAPRLELLEGQPLVQTPDPRASYLVSGAAVRLLIKKKGSAELLALIRDLGEGATWRAALEQRFELTPERLQEQLDDDLKAR